MMEYSKQHDVKKLLLQGTKSVLEAVQHLNDTGSQILLIVDDSGKLSGTLTDGDIRRCISAGKPLSAPVISKCSHLSRRVILSRGVQIMEGATVQCGVFLGENSIVNSGAVVDHDCRIASHVHIAPGAVLSGGVHVGEGAHIGTGAVVIQGISVGRNALVAAGSVVVSDVLDGYLVMGIPARRKER
ncbi:DapH/DapD/GlmU-related protein [Aminivibrio sp.]|uniref:DapH/DapD/GlmU-related protein n=1 Tax=Aminivibrio sp. TaxID=1872489 RepID=UPI001A49AFD2|nr:DapH/DapD/GlmU-related protein [Aminivibrio sp.]MBL3540696.1 hypothetical protein [Aminivibrio sp.]